MGFINFLADHPLIYKSVISYTIIIIVMIILIVLVIYYHETGNIKKEKIVGYIALAVTASVALKIYLKNLNRLTI